MLNTDKIKGLMRERRVTQADLAEKLNLKPCTVNQKLNRKRAMTIGEAEIIASYLEISDADFVKYFFTQSVT